MPLDRASSPSLAEIECGPGPRILEPARSPAPAAWNRWSPPSDQVSPSDSQRTWIGRGRWRQRSRDPNPARGLADRHRRGTQCRDDREIVPALGQPSAAPGWRSRAPLFRRQRPGCDRRATSTRRSTTSRRARSAPSMHEGRRRQLSSPVVVLGYSRTICTQFVVSECRPVTRYCPKLWIAAGAGSG